MEGCHLGAARSAATVVAHFVSVVAPFTTHKDAVAADGLAIAAATIVSFFLLAEAVAAVPIIHIAVVTTLITVYGAVATEFLNTSRATAVAVLLIAVVALLADRFLQDAVTALWERAEVGAFVVIDVVTVVTALALVLHAVATGWHGAVEAAGISEDAAVLGAIVAGFARLLNAIAAARGGAGARAIVGVVGVAVVTLLTRLLDVVAADGEEARGVAGVVIHLVAVVALFAHLDHSVTAAGQLALAAATVGVVFITVVTGFVRVLHAITALGTSAVGTAGIGGDRAVQFTVVALLGFLGNVVAADRVRFSFLAALLRTAVALRRIAVVTLLRTFENVIAADRRGAGLAGRAGERSLR